MITVRGIAWTCKCENFLVLLYIAGVKPTNESLVTLLNGKCEAKLSYSGCGMWSIFEENLTASPVGLCFFSPPPFIFSSCPAMT